MKKTLLIILSILVAVYFCNAMASVMPLLYAASVTLFFFGGSVLFLRSNPDPDVAFTCGSIATGLAANCNTKPVAGLEVDVYAFNRDDIDMTLTEAATSGRLITDLVLKAGKFGYKFSGLKTSNNSAIQMNKGKYANNWIHLWGGILFDNTADTKLDVVEKKADANLVYVVRNKWKGTNSNQEFEVLGLAVGMEANVLEKKSDDNDTQSAWKVEMKSPDGQFENNAGYILWDTNQTTTLAILENLLEPGSSS